MEDSLDRFVHELRASRSVPKDLSWLHTLSQAELSYLYQQLTQLVRELPTSHQYDAVLEPVLGATAGQLLRHRGTGSGVLLDGALVERVVELYTGLGRSSRVRHQLLSLLASDASPLGLERFRQLVIDDPPATSAAAAAPFLTLTRRADSRLLGLFPDLFAGLGQVQVASPILDLANFLTRKKIAESHPARGRTAQLRTLLDGLIHGLEGVEEASRVPGQVGPETRDQVSDSIAVVVSLCDSLALCEDQVAVPRLMQAMALKHRRIQVEAAAALARLGEAAGRQRLAQLAAEPVVRLRAIAYLEELGLDDAIPSQYVGAEARAEAELVTYLSEPYCMGLAPTSCQLLDRRSLFWPGYDDQVDCFLFQFRYDLVLGNYQNVGLAGPLVYTFRADVSHLNCEDLYALFAGWHADHEGIEQQSIGADAYRDTAFQRLKRHAEGEGFDDLVPCLDATWFGQRVLVARANREGISGVVIVEEDAVRWYPPDVIGGMDVDLIYCLDKGRKFMRAFNEPADE